VIWSWARARADIATGGASLAQVHNEGNWIGSGEEAAARLLSDGLPPKWHIFCNKLLPAPAYAPPLYYELDFVVVGEHGVYVVDEKSWSGPISGSESLWRTSRGRQDISSPAKIADRRAVMLRGALQRNDARLRDLRSFVRGLVLLSNDNDITQLRAPIGQKAILFSHDACSRLQACDAELSPPSSSISQYRDRIIDYLLDRPRRQAMPKAFGDYEVVAELASLGPVRTFLAHTDDGRTRLLRVILRPQDAGQCEEKRNYLLREFDVLERLQPADRAPRVHDHFSFQWSEEYWVIPIEPVAGESLRRVREAPEGDRAMYLTSGEARLSIMRDAFRGLQEVHDLGVLHRGLTPDRVHIRDRDQRVIFSDFLIARADDGDSVASTADQMDPGNAYRAPECVSGPEFAEPATDVYGLAASLVYWLTGIEPSVTDSPSWPPDIAGLLPAGLGGEARRLLTECLTEDGSARPTAEQMTRELSPPKPEARGRRRRPRATVWVAIAAVAVVCVVLAVLGARLLDRGAAGPTIDKGAGSTLAWSQAAQVVGDGKIHTVEGPVRSMLRQGNSVYLGLGNPYPTKQRFTIEVELPSGRIAPAAFAEFLGAEVKATGQIHDIAGVAGVALHDPADITITDAGPPIVDWSEAKDYEGHEVVVSGALLRSRHYGDRPAGTTYLDFNRRYPSTDRFTIKITKSARSRFFELMGMSDFRSWARKTLWVQGKVEQADQTTSTFVPQVTADPLMDIWVGD
jgi:serine/threonine protein kinase